MQGASYCEVSLGVIGGIELLGNTFLIPQKRLGFSRSVEEKLLNL
jgi:hypothetical protein